MKNRMTIIQLSFLILIFCVQNGNGQSKKVEFEVQSSTGYYLGTTEALSQSDVTAHTSEEKLNKLKQDKKPLNFIGRRSDPNKILSPTALPKGQDPLVQQSFQKKMDRPLDILVNQDGLTAGSPNDPCGDVGKDHFVQMINATSWRVFNKDGSPASASMSMNAIWSQVGFSSAGDPIILYDQEFDRWILTEFPFQDQLLVAISETSDPLGEYKAYNFPTPDFPDYPKFGLWNNTLYVTTNEGTGVGESHAYFIDREALLNGDDEPAIQRIEFPGVGGPGFNPPSWYTPTPVDWSSNAPPPSSTPPMILNLIDDGWGFDYDGIDIYKFEIDFSNPDNTDIEITEVMSAPFASDDTQFCAALGPGFACVPQPNGQGIDGIPHVIMHQAHYRNFGTHETIVLNFAVNVGDGEPVAGIRWMELRKTDELDWYVYQEGTFGPDDGGHRFMGAIAMDGKGNIGLAYTVSGPEIFPSLRVTGRYASDPLGEMTIAEEEFAPGVGSNNGPRFGDYAQMVVDPIDDETFWFTAEYLGNPNSSTTRILSFQFDRDTNDIGPSLVMSPQNNSLLSSEETVRVQVKNFGFETKENFQVGYAFEGVEMEIDEVNFTLEADSLYTHTFDTKVDMSEIGEYDFQFFTIMDDDTFSGNDTLRTSIKHLPQRDAQVIRADIPESLCGDNTDINFTVKNLGADTLTFLIIDITLNGNLESISWNGNLGYLEEVEIPHNLSPLIEGENTVIFESRLPNGMEDQDLSNDRLEDTFEAIVDAGDIFVNLFTDEYPEETTWEILDETGNVIASGGPYQQELTLITESVCVDPDACYTFTIYDSFGDGICCAFGEGNYQILDAQGAPLLTSNGEFGDEETSAFCAEFMCMMSSNVFVIPTSGPDTNDGTIIIETTNAPGEIQYSIDNGETFQSESVFNDLPPGDYVVIIESDFGCMNADLVSVGFCNLDAIIEVTDETVIDQSDGSIVITEVTGGSEPYIFSIDNGASFQAESTFDNLTNGTYSVIIRDAEGCEYTAEVEVNYITSTEETAVQTYQFFITPNPTKGIFKVFLDHPAISGNHTNMSILDASGKLIQSAKLAKWNGVFEGSFSLVAYPDGLYYIRIHDENIKKMVKVIKQ